jgi:hypothetical protein
MSAKSITEKSMPTKSATTMITKMRWLCFCLVLLMLACCFAAAGENKPVSLDGTWQLSWEARIGTERGIMRLKQVDSGLAGSFQGGALGSPKISGKIEGKNINLKLDFQGTHTFTLVFIGTVDGDKMEGKFEIQNLADGYDWHGENVRPSNYSWTAIRQTDQTPVENNQRSSASPNAANSKASLQQ